jgi:predicted O-methyltransferase YrrM
VGLDARGIISTKNIGKRRVAGPWDVILVDHGPTMQTRLDDLEALTPTLAPTGAIVLDDFRRRTNYAPKATAELERLGLTVTVPPRSQSGDRALGVGYLPG